MSEESLELRFGSESGQRVVIRILRRPYPESEHSSDQQWLDADVEVVVGRFKGRYTAYFEIRDFQALETGLRELHKTLRGSVLFDPLESQLVLEFVGDGLGHINVRGTAQDEAGVGNKLTFELELDQTDLPKALGVLRDIGERYPVSSAESH